MKVITHISEIATDLNLGLTMGNFDGLHLGHKRFIEEFHTLCKSKKLLSLVVTFVPHPMITLKNKTNFLINTYEQRRSFFRELGTDYLLEIDFTRDFSTQAPEKFLDEYIFRSKNIKYFYLGHDFSFGANKAGDHNFIETYCEDKSVEFKVQQQFQCGDDNVSSTLIRKFLEEGNLQKANTYLGREYFIEGLVVKGEGKGRKIGFPTANLEFDEEILMPGRGVYVSLTETNGERYISVTNVGLNPTFNLREKITVETHLLDFDRYLYGEKVKVFFMKKLRDEKKFPNVNELITQIKKDVELTRSFHHD